MLRRIAIFLFVAATVSAQEEAELESLVRTFMSVYATVETESAAPVDSYKAIYGGAIPGMLRPLDPHSVFFDPGQFEQLKQLQTSTQKGFGSVVSVLPGRVIFLQTLPGTPSAKSGLAAGDEIVGLNGYLVSQLEVEQLIALLSQSRQQAARLDVRRPGNARILTFVLTPEELQAPSVERTFHLSPGIGYLRVSSFDEKTGEQIHAGIEKLGGRNLKGLVLDLRNNPGGLLPAALQTAALFLKPGQRILTVRGRNVPESEQKVPADSQPYEFPVAVLINEKSASASEIVSGSLQDHDRAVVIGQPSFGKGLVESVYPLSDNTGMALTTALYYTPSGRSIQKPLGDAFALGKTSANPNHQADFRTDGGRVVKGGGGIEPDFVVQPAAPPTRLAVVLDMSGAFTNFATEYTQKHNNLTEDFQVTSQLLDEFQLFLSERSIRPGIGDWLAIRPFIENRLKTEIFNQRFGVEKGDEVEASRDPAILKALEEIAKAK